MKVIVHWEETWQRAHEFEVDEAALTEWLDGEPVTGAKVKEFILAGRDEPNPDQLMGATRYPGEEEFDVYDGLEITKVVIP